MSCILRIGGKKFDSAAFAKRTEMPVVSVFSKGEKVFPKNKRSQRKTRYSGVHILISKAWFDNPAAQIRGARRFCDKHKRELQRLRRLSGIEFLVMDFGIGQRDVVVQGDAFPPDLLAYLGKYGIELMISTYPVSKPGKSRNDVLESQLENRAERIQAGRARTNTWRRG